MASFGRTSCGWWASDFYRPSIAAFVRDVDKARMADRNTAGDVPLPCGWPIDVAKSQLLIESGIGECPHSKLVMALSPRLPKLRATIHRPRSVFRSY